MEGLGMFGQEADLLGDLGHLDLKRPFGGPGAGEGMGNGADAADAGCQERGHFNREASKHDLEIPGAFDNVPRAFGKLAVFNANADVAVSFHASNVFDFDFYWFFY